VPQAGGKPQPVTKPAESGARDRWPQILPGGGTMLVTRAPGRNSGYEDAELAVCSLRTGQCKVVQRGGYSGRYLPSGHLVYVHQGTLFAVAFDLRKLETRGTPIPVLDDIDGNPTRGGGQFNFAGNGTFVYLAGKASRQPGALVWMDKSGAAQPILTDSSPTQTPRLSPDGKLLAVAIDRNLVVHDPARGSSARIINGQDGSVASMFPIWLPDGKHIISSSGSLGATGIWWSRSDGSSKPEQIYQTSAVAQSVSPDGKALAWHESGDARDLYTAPLDLTDPDHAKLGKPEPFAVGRGNQVDPAFSPDGRWLAYSSGVSDTYHVFVRPFPEGAKGAGQVQVSAAKGRFPLWSRTSKELFYVTQPDAHIMVVPYAINGRTFSPAKPEVWSPAPIRLDGNNIPLDLAPDGKRFVVSPATEPSTAEKANLHVTFLLNFFDELWRRVP
jgi:serine/threonine-protein kinase